MYLSNPEKFQNNYFNEKNEDPFKNQMSQSDYCSPFFR